MILFLKFLRDFGVRQTLKTKRYVGLISIENVQEIVYAESNGHVTAVVTRPYDVARILQA